MRLNRFLSLCGVCANRKAHEILQSKNVTLNDKRVKKVGISIDPQKDSVKINGRLIQLPKQRICLAFYKPKKVLATMKDPKNRLCLADYFKKSKGRLFPVGRLDWESEGLILLTNDGDLSMKITHPKYKVFKTYLVKLNGRPTHRQLLALQKGVTTVVGKVKAFYARALRRTVTKHSWIKIIIAEGKNRQLHHMFQKIGFQIKVLKRMNIGKLKLKSLRPGESIFLNEKDIEKIFSTPSELKNKFL